MRRFLLVVVVVAALAAVSATGALADYGPGTAYQVAISANNLHGPSFWFWAALGPGTESDYVNTDCIHLSAGGNPGARDAAHNSSGQLDSWSDSNGTLEMDGVKIVGGAAIADFFISDAPHSNQLTVVVTQIVDPSALPPTFHVGTTFSFTGGPQTEVQVATAP
jgi:hypothetical protein